MLKCLTNNKKVHEIKIFITFTTFFIIFHRCNMWAAENNNNSSTEISNDRDFILKLHKKQDNEEIVSQVSDYNNNDQTRRNSVSEYSENQDSTYLTRLSESHKSHHGGRRRSSLAALNTRNLKKNPAISKLLLKINEAQHKYRKY